MPDSYRELFVKPSATNASNINGGSSETRLFQRTNGNWNSSTKVFTATGDTLDSAWVGQLACVCNDGTTTGVYFAEVTAIDNTAKTIALSSTRTLGGVPSTSTTARTITIGGAWSGMSGTTTFPFSIATWSSVTNAAGDRVRINVCGSFSVTTNINFTGTAIVIEGYATVVADEGHSDITYTGSSNVAAFQVGGGGGVVELRCIEFSNTSSNAAPTPSTSGLTVTTASGVGMAIIKKCRFSDCVGPGLTILGSASVNKVSVVNCEFMDCVTQTVASNFMGVISTLTDAHVAMIGCLFHHNDGVNVASCLDMSGGPVSVLECVFASNSVAFDDANSISPINCVFYSNTTAMKLSPASSRFGVHAIGCIFENNTTAISRGNTTADRQPTFEKCAFYNNTTKLDSNATGRVFLVNCLDASTSTMVDPANGDFRTKESNLRNAIDGSLLQSSGSYTTFTTRRRDIGIGPSNPYYNGQ